MYMLPRVKHIASGKLLCNRGSPSRGSGMSVMTQRGVMRGGTEGQEEGDIYLPLTHTVVEQKVAQHCKAITLQFKVN